MSTMYRMTIVQTTHLIAPVFCVGSGITGIPFSMWGVMLNTARHIAQDMNTDMSARSRPVFRYELIVSNFGCVVPGHNLTQLDYVNSDQLCYGTYIIPPPESKGYFPWVWFWFVTFGLDEP